MSSSNSLYYIKIYKKFSTTPSTYIPDLISILTNINGNNVQFKISENITANYYWDFGDGNTSTEQNPTHSYNNIGIYKVYLKLCNDNLCKVINTIVYIRPQIETNNEIGCTAKFNIYPNNIGYAPFYAIFINTSIGDITSYYWDFGDGNTSTERNPYHLYINKGLYKVKLTIVDNAGITSTYTTYIDIIGKNVKIGIYEFYVNNEIDCILNNDGNVNIDNPILQVNTNIINNFDTSFIPKSDYLPLCTPTANIYSGQLPLTIKFFANSSTDDVFYYWNFGDGNVSTEQNPIHTYTSPNIYKVILKVKNGYGETTSQLQIIVFGKRSFYRDIYFTYIIYTDMNYIFIYDGSNNFFKKFGGAGSELGFFNKPTTLTVVKPIF